MENNAITTIFLPAALGIIMLGLGLTLTVADFRRVVQFPKAVLVGLACQMLILPFVCLGIASGFGLAPVLAVGLMLLAASPGGATANLFSHLAHGDVALNITLTAINSVLAIFTMPIIVNLSLAFFMEGDETIPLQFRKVVEVFAVVLLPVGIGMLIRSRRRLLAQRLERPVRFLSAAFLVLIVIGAIAKQWDDILAYFPQVGGAALAFNILSMVVGYFVPRAFGVSDKQAIATGMEIGIHNGTLAIYLAVSVLGSMTMAMPAAIYSILMFFTAAAFGWLVNRRQQRATEAEDAA